MISMMSLLILFYMTHKNKENLLKNKAHWLFPRIRGSDEAEKMTSQRCQMFLVSWI